VLFVREFMGAPFVRKQNRDVAAREAAILKISNDVVGLSAGRGDAKYSGVGHDREGWN
jgi:hypothetical protein